MQDLMTQARTELRHEPIERRVLDAFSRKELDALGALLRRFADAFDTAQS